MKIEDRVVEAIEAGIEGKWEMGMTLICPAIEATARKKLSKQAMTNREFKSFVRDNYFIIEAFIGAGLNLQETKFPNVVLDTDRGRVLEAPDFADIVYHAFRCALEHGHEIADKFAFTTSHSQGVSKWVIGMRDGRIHVPDKTLWALIACVIFSEANADLSTNTSYYLNWGGAPAGREPPYRFDVDVFWGGEHQVKRFLKSKNLIRVAVNPQ
ncbi:MAG: hypothetical protein JJ891_01830 [Rhizobiaceae bacterium]|nr:hypothetical protein [Rhizobiaceae bacterium]